jgi:pimeloyl-ACP methyl ester carboxylesterase
MKNYRIWGKPPYSTAVVHGGPGAAGAMAAVADELSKTTGVLEPLQTRNSVNRQIEELHNVLEKHAGLPVTLVGHSWGAWLVFIFAGRYPAMVKKLVLVSSGPFKAKYAAGIDAERLCRLSEEDKVELLRLWETVYNPGASEKDQALGRLGALATKADTYAPLPPQYFKTPDGLKVSADTFNKLMPEALEMRASGKLLLLGEQIKCPVVAIHGDYDTHPAEGVKEPLSRVLKDFKFILLKKCGHEPWIERYARDEFFRVLRYEMKVSDGK